MINSHKAKSTEKMTSKTNCDPWITDTGALNHMVGNLGCLNHLKSISSCSVGLPKGNIVPATKEKSVQLDDNMILSNILYIPILAYNLIFVSQAIDDSDCVAASLNIRVFYKTALRRC